MLLHHYSKMPFYSLTKFLYYDDFTTLLPILLIIAACLTTIAVNASNYFYIDVPVLTENDLGTDITLPVKAHFDNPVSTWDVEFSFPEGLTPVSVTRGRDMNITYFDYDCNVRTQKCNIFYNQDLTHFASSTYGMRAFLSEEDYEYDNYSLLKWDAGTYEKMFLMTFHVDTGCSGGEIHVISRSTCAETPDITYDPNQTFSVECDINLDGTISMADITDLLYIIAGVSYKNNRDEEEPGLRGDVNHDGVVNIIDLEMLNDYINLSSWFTGYQLYENDSYIEVLMVNNYPGFVRFYIDDTILTESDKNTDITIPVKAEFESYISSWDVQFTFPEGLTPVALSHGSDMNLTYIDDSGWQHVGRADYSVSQDKTHVAASSNLIGYIEGEDGDYEPFGSVKWTGGNYDEMMLLTLHVGPDFQQGAILISSNATCGIDTRNENLYFWPVTMNEPIDDEGNYYGYLYGDVNHDGIITMTDLILYLNYIVGNVNSNEFAVHDGDTHQDGVIDILDMEKTRDLILWDENGQWHEGYTLSESENESWIIIEHQEPIPGDMNGDGILTVSDITILINLLLNSGENYYSNLADMNSDGVFNISDVTLLISSVLNAQQ